MNIPARRILLAGVAGGLAEVLWISFCGAVTPLASADVAREVTATVFGPLAIGGYSVEAGLAIHFLLAIAIASVFSRIVPAVARIAGGAGIMMTSLAWLITIWGVNFFVLLPIVNAHFTELMPLPVTLTSKLLFGLAQGVVFAAPSSRRSHHLALQ